MASATPKVEELSAEAGPVGSVVAIAEDVKTLALEAVAERDKLASSVSIDPSVSSGSTFVRDALVLPSDSVRTGSGCSNDPSEAEICGSRVPVGPDSDTSLVSAVGCVTPKLGVSMGVFEVDEMFEAVADDVDEAENLPASVASFPMDSVSSGFDFVRLSLADELGALVWATMEEVSIGRSASEEPGIDEDRVVPSAAEAVGSVGAGGSFVSSSD